MRTQRLATLPMLLIAVGGLIVGLAAPAAGREASHLISGTTIKKHSIAGDRMKNNTLTGKQIKESTLGTVPRAKTLPPLKWHPITHFLNGWKAAPKDAGTLSVAYAVDAQGVVHLRGAITGGIEGDNAFALPAALAPKSLILNLSAVMGDNPTPGVVEIRGGFVQPWPNGGAATFDTFLDGLSYTTT
jgi:hypothetical protein